MDLDLKQTIRLWLGEEGGAVAEWSKALLWRVNKYKNKRSSVCPPPPAREIFFSFTLGPSKRVCLRLERMLKFNASTAAALILRCQRYVHVAFFRRTLFCWQSKWSSKPWFKPSTSNILKQHLNEAGEVCIERIRANLSNHCSRRGRGLMAVIYKVSPFRSVRNE